MVEEQRLRCGPRDSSTVTVLSSGPVGYVQQRLLYTYEHIIVGLKYVLLIIKVGFSEILYRYEGVGGSNFKQVQADPFKMQLK